jgi:hypothetical protein
MQYLLSIRSIFNSDKNVVIGLEMLTEIFHINWNASTKSKLNSVALARKRTIPTERPQPVGEVSANFCG